MRGSEGGQAPSPPRSPHSQQCFEVLQEPHGPWHKWGFGWTPPHKMDQHLSGERWGDRPWACPPVEIPYKRKGGPALPAVSPQLGQRAEEISWTVSPRSPAPAPQRGLQAELVNAPQMRELRKGQDGTKLSPCFPTSREPPLPPLRQDGGGQGGTAQPPWCPAPCLHYWI